MLAKKAKKVANANIKPSRKALPPVQIASASKKFHTADILNMYSNPSYTDQELEYFEDAWASSVVGSAIDKLMEYVMGGGVRPTFELIDDKGKDENQVKKELEKYDKELNELIHYDRKINFQKKLLDATTMAKVFGRCVMVFEPPNGLPTALKIIHPRDLGRIFLDQKDWSIQKVITTFPSDELTPDEMIYFCNRPDSPRRRTMWYGYSDLQRVVGAARAWRRIIEFDMPEVTTSAWAGYGMFILKKLGRSSADATLDANTLLNSLNAGAFNCVTVDSMDEIEFKNLDLEPKIREMVELASFYERILIGNFAVPSALLGREEDQNRATLIGKIQFFLSGPVKAAREWISDQISQQWYERNMRHMGMGDLLKVVRVKAEFEAVQVESWFDLVESVMKLKAILPNLPNDKILELLNLEEIKDDLEDMPEGWDNVNNPMQNIPQGIPNVNPSSGKPFSQIKDVGASREIDNETIHQALNLKKAQVLDKLEKMIDKENGHTHSKNSGKRD